MNNSSSGGNNNNNNRPPRPAHQTRTFTPGSRPPGSNSSGSRPPGSRPPFGSRPAGTGGFNRPAGTGAPAAGGAPRPAGTGGGFRPRPGGGGFGGPRPAGARPGGPGGFRPPRPGYGRGFRRPEVEEAHRINDRITAREVRVIGEEGEQLGIMPTSEAISRAQDLRLDLVEVAPNSTPPVCRIMDYGKFKYREQKKEAEAKKNRVESKLKEIRLSYRTDTGDLETKLKHAREFLEEGDKVKFSMRFKGREVMFLKLGGQKFDEIIANLADVGQVDERSPLAGRQIHLTLAPVKGKAPKKPGSDQPKKDRPAGESEGNNAMKAALAQATSEGEKS